jgi:hypothetical protein
VVQLHTTRFVEYSKEKMGSEHIDVRLCIKYYEKDLLNSLERRE